MQQNQKPIFPSLLRFADRCFLALMLIMLPLAATAHTASVYVEVDSWVYPAAERLAVLTGAQAEVTGMRPWTRSQFAHFLERAREMQHDAEASGLQDSLEREFSSELNSEIERQALESTYVRTTQIAGTPLRDSYHFGQTFVNDFGRPYGQGFNAISGSSAYVQHRAGMLYVRAEYQHGASLARPPASAIDFLTEHDWVTSNQVLTQGGPSVDNPRLLDAYVGTSFGHWTATLGKQSLWWGPAAGGAFLESNNAEPSWMGRLTNDLPYKVPLLGKARLDMFYGKLQGHVYLAQPWIHGEKISFQPFNNFEVGFTRTVVFLGMGRGFTFRRLWHSYVNIDDGSPGNSNADTAANDPGDRRSGIDFSWKLPKVPVTLYSDGFSDDEPSPLASPTRSAFHPGVYVAQLPGPLAKVDLRVEGSYTTSENPSISNGFNYWNSSYRDGYTNKGLLIGDPVGRAGVQWQVWSTYWLSPRNKIQVSFRDHYVSPHFLQGGGTQSTFRTSSNFQPRRGLDLELGVQSERVVMPLLTGTLAPKYNMSGWLGVKYSPEHKGQ